MKNSKKRPQFTRVFILKSDLIQKRTTLLIGNAKCAAYLFEDGEVWREYKLVKEHRTKNILKKYRNVK